MEDAKIRTLYDLLVDFLKYAYPQYFDPVPVDGLDEDDPINDGIEEERPEDFLIARSKAIEIFRLLQDVRVVGIDSDELIDACFSLLFSEEDEVLEAKPLLAEIDRSLTMLSLLQNQPNAPKTEEAPNAELKRLFNVKSKQISEKNIQIIYHAARQIATLTPKFRKADLFRQAKLQSPSLKVGVVEEWLNNAEDKDVILCNRETCSRSELFTKGFQYWFTK